tara:strand:+ start:3927 stop:4691 length:765 start_codon:yes stop_codon:yes gene_type:complete
MENPTASDIWKTLSAVNVNEHTESKAVGDRTLTYLSWAWAWTVMMEHYPQLSVKWHGMTDSDGVTRDITTYPGGTASVCCSVRIGESVKREMWLPVMNYKNQAVTNPDSFAINTAKMRCLTKCFALLGLGAYIYAGEDLPPTPTVEVKEAKKAPAKKAAPKKKAASKKKKAPKVEEVSGNNETDDPEMAVKSLIDAANMLHERGWTPDEETQRMIRGAVKGEKAEEAVKLTKVIMVMGEAALKLNGSEEEATDG